MAQTVIRAAQNTLPITENGGTRDPRTNQDLGAFMEAIEDESTHFLNSLKKGGAGTMTKEYGGVHQIMPRGSRVAAAVTAAVTSLPIIPGHGTRFQQGQVVRVTGANGYEIMWVNADPATGALSVKRAQGNTVALAFAANDEVKSIGIAMPELSNFPLSPVSTGKQFWWTYQKFDGHLEMSDEARMEPTQEFGSGDYLGKQMVGLGKRMKRELDQALLLGHRQTESQDPADPRPRMLGGLVYYAEASGNVYSGGGRTTALSLDFIENVTIDRDEKYGDNAKRRWVMSPRTAMVISRLAHPAKYQAGVSDNKIDLRFTTLMTGSGDVEFSTLKGLPDGTIFLYEDSNHEYGPFTGLDWKEKEVETKGDWEWRGMSGTFGYRPKHPDAYALVNNFSMDLSAYPRFAAV